MEAGFNAKSSFNAAVKRHAGVTPSEYRRQRAEAA
jgi:AraC-like DNA-binding protein